MNVVQHNINTKKLKPGLVASYNIRPGNREGLFWFWRFINMSLTYLLRPVLTAPGSTRGQHLKVEMQSNKPVDSVNSEDGIPSNV